MKNRASQLNLAFRPTHGGKRKGAGRHNRSGLRSHLKRPKLESRHPVHVTLKIVPGLPSLRRKDVFRSLRHAVKLARLKGLHVVQFAILSNHVHLILETDQNSLRRPMQSFGISFSKRVNRLLNRLGSVLLDRYHLHVLKTPTEVRRVLAYVLTNEAKHRHQVSHRLIVSIDPFSSAFRFRAWKSLLGKKMGEKVDFRFTSWSEAFIAEWYAEILSEARTWLLQRGWERVGSRLATA